MNELADVFADLEDPRAVNARRHSLHHILVIVLCTVVSGDRPRAAARRKLCPDMELYGHAKRDLLQSFLKQENGIPSHDTFSRVLKVLDPGAFQRRFPGFMGQFAEGIAVWWRWMARPCAVLTTGPPGNRRCIWSAPGPTSSAWCWDRWPSLLTNHDKSNEITAVPRLLEMLSLRGKVVTPIFDQSGHALPAAGDPAEPAPCSDTG